MRKIYTHIIIIIVIALICLCAGNAQAQNKYEEVIPFEFVDGNIVFPATVDGKEYKFLFDPCASPAILEEYAKDMGVKQNDIVVSYTRPGVQMVSGGGVERFCIGKNIFVEKLGTFVIKDDYLRKIGVAGIMNANPFVGYVLTINAKDKTLTTSTPYKPSYISLKNQAPMDKKILSRTSIEINGTPIEVAIDLVGNKELLSLSAKDFAALKPVLSSVKEGVDIKRYPSYQAKEIKASTANLSQFTFAKSLFAQEDVSIVMSDTITTIGAKILHEGLLSFDYAKGRVYFQRFGETKIPATNLTRSQAAEKSAGDSKIVHLTRMNFTDLVFDYKNETEWNYKGDKPAIIDFWAPWCGPCKKMNPILEELAKEYDGQIIVYKLNIDDEPEISKYFKVNAIPLLVYIPMEGKITKINGATTKESIMESIESFLLKGE